VYRGELDVGLFVFGCLKLVPWWGGGMLGWGRLGWPFGSHFGAKSLLKGYHRRLLFIELSESEKL